MTSGESPFDGAMRLIGVDYQHLESRNVNIGEGGRRTSLRLNPFAWEVLEEITRRENMSGIDDLIGRIAALIGITATYETDGSRKSEILTARIRLFLLAYYTIAGRGGRTVS